MERVDRQRRERDRAVLEAALAQSPVGAFVADALGGLVHVNDRWCGLIGMSRMTTLGHGWTGALHPDDRAGVLERWWASIRSGAPLECSAHLLLADGTDRRATLTANRVSGRDGSTTAWVGSLVPDRRSESGPVEPVVRAALAHSADLLVIVDRTGTVTWVSPSAPRVLGVPAQEPVGRELSDLVHPDDAPTALEAILGFGGDRSVRGAGSPVQLRIRAADGTWRDVEIVATDFTDDPDVDGVLLDVRDVAGRTLAEQRLAVASEGFRMAFHRSPIGMALTTLDGRYLRVNEALCELLDRTPANMLATTVLETTHPDDLRATVDAALELLEGDASSFVMEKRFLAGDGRPVWVRASATLLRDDAGQPLHFLTQIEDIEERRRLIEELRRSALRDPLTGLSNRAGLAEHLESLGDDRIGAIVLDLDGFKDVNDSAGHAAGDEVLRVVADRIRATLRSADHAARTGGDEFLVVCSPPGGDLAELGARLVRAIRAPIRIGEVDVSVGASAGVAEGVASDASAVLTRADHACYRAKRRGGDLVDVA